MSGSGAKADRDEFPARSLCHLPCVSRETVQPADAGNPLSRPVDRRRVGPAGGRGSRVLSEPRDNRPLAGQPAGGGPWLCDAGSIVDHAQRRRGPANQAGHRVGPRQHRQDLLPSRRTDHRAALRRHQEAPCRARPPGRSGQHSGSDRAQHRRNEDGRLDHRPRSRRRRRRRADHRHRHAGRDRGD